MTAATRYRRRGKCEAHLVDSDIFLVTRSTIRHLNPTAAAIWLAIEEPASRRELLEILRSVFPAVDPKRLASDIAQFLRAFSKVGLIVPAKPRCRRPGKRKS